MTYDSCSQDGRGAGLLPVLVSNGGDLDVTLGMSTQTGFFNSLLTVDGDLTVRNGAWPPNLDGTGAMFNSLTTVTGTFHAIDVFIMAAPTPRAFDALSVAGTLDRDSCGTMEEIGAAAVAIDDLHLNDKRRLAHRAVDADERVHDRGGRADREHGQRELATVRRASVGPRNARPHGPGHDLGQSGLHPSGDLPFERAAP